VKNISVLVAFAAFAIVMMIGSVTVSGPGASVEYITSSIIIPAAQELPVQSQLAQNWATLRVDRIAMATAALTPASVSANSSMNSWLIMADSMSAETLLLMGVL
jgi:hypothetical protein